MTITIDADKAISLLREVVKGNEDVIYKRPAETEGPACVYQSEGKPSCVVGQALFKAGVTAETLAEMDRQGSTGIGIVPLPDTLVLTREARLVFSSAQQVQDRYNPWGMALDNAEREHAFLTSPRYLTS